MVRHKPHPSIAGRFQIFNFFLQDSSGRYANAALPIEPTLIMEASQITRDMRSVPDVRTDALSQGGLRSRTRLSEWRDGCEMVVFLRYFLAISIRQLV